MSCLRTSMASSTLGPTRRAELPCQTASSTSLGSNRVSRTSGSRAPTATRSWSTLLLPAPGSPPRSRLRSGRVTVTSEPSSSVPTGMGCHSDSAPAPTNGQGTGLGSARGSRRRTTTLAWRALAGSRTTRTSRTERKAAMRSAWASRSGTWLPAGTRTRSCSPARVSRQRVILGIRSLAVASSAWRQANAHRRRRCDRNRACARGSRVQVTMATTNAAATMIRWAPSRPRRWPSHI
jgi:hypothetical protein